jgi:hypothetical protein
MIIDIFTEKASDHEETIKVWVAHRACALTKYVPGEPQKWEALVVPTGSQPEFVPSPQSKRYWI